MTERDREYFWKKAVKAYEIEVPDELVENEVAYFTAQAKHCLQYDALTGGGDHPFVALEVEQQMDDIREAAYFEAKSELILKAELKANPPVVTAEELQAEAEALCERENTTMDFVRRFFGDDLKGLESDLRRKKIMERLAGEYKAKGKM